MRLIFDRGTLVVREVEDDFDASALPGALWDPRVGAFRCPAHRKAEIVDVVSKAGVPISDEVSETWCDRPISGHPIQLRPYQQAALTAWRLSGGRGIVVLPTGSGKTRVALAAVMEAHQPALCLVPTRVLLEQWARTIKDLTGCQPGIYGDGERSLGPVTVATFESAWRHMEHLGNRFGLLIVDEVHHFGSGIRDEALEMCVAARRLGLTATPPAASACERLSVLVGPVIYELAVADLAGTFLAPFESVVVRVSLDPDERAEYDSLEHAFREVLGRFRRFFPGASWEDFMRAAARTDEGRRAIAAFHRARRLLAFPRAKREALGELLAQHRRLRTLVFVGDNETAYAVARAHLIMPLTCDIGRKERQRALDLFREGTLQTLVSAQVLNEGLDVPDAEVGIVVAGRLGEREHVQRIGRLLRPREGKRALLYELVVRGTREIRQAAKRRRAVAS